MEITVVHPVVGHVVMAMVVALVQDSAAVPSIAVIKFLKLEWL